MFDWSSIFNGIVANIFYSLLGLLFIGFTGWKFYKNRNIKVKKSKIEKSFKGISQNIDIEKSEIRDSFN